MALSAAGIQAAIEQKMQAAGLVLTGEHAQGKKLAKAIAEAIYEELTGKAIVTVTTVGGPTAQTGTGTIS